MLLYFVIGLIVGIILSIMVRLIAGTDGILRVDHSNPEKDIYRFEINELEKLNKKRRIRLKVDHNADLSQK